MRLLWFLLLWSTVAAANPNAARLDKTNHSLLWPVRDAVAGGDAGFFQCQGRAECSVGPWLECKCGAGCIAFHPVEFQADRGLG